MAHAPGSANWFLADLVEAITVGDDPRIVVHINTVLIRAQSPAAAFQKANERGRRSNLRYRNPNGEKVVTRFLGLGDLAIVHDPLEDGCELIYRERVVRSMAAAKKLKRRRSQLSVFAPRVPSTGPSYMPADVAARMEAELGPDVLTRGSQSGRAKAASKRKQGRA